MFELVDDGFEVVGVVGNAASGVDGPDEVYVVLAGCLGEAAYDFGFVGGIVVAPLCAMVGVVFGPVDVDVELVAPVEVELALAVGIAPGVAVETFDDTSLGACWPV